MMEEDIVVPSTLALNVQAFLVLLMVFLILVLVQQWMLSPSNLPPGPMGWPVVGILPRVGKPSYRTFQLWWEDYGDVYSVYMGGRLVIIVNGVQAMKECFLGKAAVVNSRPWNYFKKITGNTGLVFSDGQVWKEHRRFSLRTLRDFGMGKTGMQKMIQEELALFSAVIAKADGKPIELRALLPRAISNVICSIIYGSRFEYDDPVFSKNIEALNVSVRNQSIMKMINFIPILEFAFKFLPKPRMLMGNVKMRREYAQQQIDAHKQDFDPHTPRDFIDVYLNEMRMRKEGGQETTFDEVQLNRTIQDLFIAGTETINNTLKWAFLFMVLNEEVQTLVQREIDDVIGSARMPTLRDRDLMTYTQATLCECQRLGNITLFSVPRCTTQDTTLCGYHVPKGAWIFFNRWGIHTSPRYWKDPRKFDPSRYIDKDGKFFKPEAFVPFGVGPRMCAGETMSRMELFLFFTTILQAFKLRLPEGRPLPSLEPIMGINNMPQPYEICAVLR